ncbi:hypothetical protein CHS0354_016343 [Potamilus streckersoni]|uniref:Aminopeptidase N-like N-terminal domain-containing protein n=1 Tax=Potamilus streckersoni TaxID=2493646 RepID=A0AAE0SMX1_9BIVA|nr:hypothetical protein CHS0354_016343 [Potamilus streckersoni]
MKKELSSDINILKESNAEKGTFCNSHVNNDVSIVHGYENECYSKSLKIRILLTVGFLALLFIVIFVAFFLKENRILKNDEQYCICDNVTNNFTLVPSLVSISTVDISNATGIPSWSSVTKETSTNSSYLQPWEKIRLDMSVIPHHYDLELITDLLKAACQGNRSFTGSVAITIEVQSRTNLISIHVKELALPGETVSVKEKDTNTSLQIRRQFYYNDTEKYVIEMEQSLEKGFYTVVIGHFSGCIIPDLVGLYLCSYKTSSGETRLRLHKSSDNKM